MQINRRSVMASVAAFCGLPVAATALADMAAEPVIEEQAFTPQKIADTVAEWELHSIQHNHPDWWERIRYESAIQWDSERLVLFGVGDPANWEARRAELIENFTSEEWPLLASAEGEGRRSWAIVVSARLSPCAQEELLRVAKPRSKQAQQVASIIKPTFDPFANDE